MIHKHSSHVPLPWRDGDLRWLGALLCVLSAALVVLIVVVLVR